MGHLLGYARVSTVDQDPALQLDALTSAGCARVWVDRASGALTERPQLDALLAALLPGDTLVVWKLDRLGRSLSHLLTVVNELAERGIGFRSLTEGMDTTTAAGRLLLAVCGALAQFERDLIRERTVAGLDAARRRGSQPGRPDGDDPRPHCHCPHHERRRRAHNSDRPHTRSRPSIGVPSAHHKLVRPLVSGAVAILISAGKCRLEG